MINSADQSGFFTTTLESALGWARKYSLFSYPFVTACCGMEFMSVNCSHYDTDRFGAALPRFTPRQSDLLWVVGTVNHKLAPVLLRVYEQMAEPKWVVAFGACASSGGFYDNYTTVAGIDKIIPVDMYIPGCPPRPETVLDALMHLQDDIQRSRQQIVHSQGGKQHHPDLPPLLGQPIDTRLTKPV
jgi:NADH-quinone oxidoreductase subunit B